jgi:DNA-binding beta-propeller fold protein YncE
MVNGFARYLAVCLVVAALLVTGVPQQGLAADPPKWVAALYVEAQRSVGLRWMAVPGATGYKVLRSEKQGADYKEVGAPAQPQFFDPTVEPGTTYFYVLQSVAAEGPSANSDEKALTIPGQKKKVLEAPVWSKDPAVQESTEFGKTSYKVGLFWIPNRDAIAYNVYKTLTPGKDYTLLVSGAEPQAVDTAVEAGKTYYYVDSALDGSFQETPYSVEKKVTVEAKKSKGAKKAVKLVVAPRTTTKIFDKTKGAENGKFDLFEPFDLAIDERGDILYVTSNNGKRVYGLNATTGDLVYDIGGPGKDPGLFLYPLGLDVDGDGTLYVVDRQKATVQTFVDGKFKKEFPLQLPPELNIKEKPFPMDVAVDRKSGEIFVCDRGLNRIWVLDDDGKFQRLIGEPGTEVGQIMVPEYLGFNPAGNLVVINANKTRVSTYDPKTGKHLRSWGEARPGVGSFIFIGGFAFDKEGDIVVMDKSSAMAQGFLEDGRYLYNFANDKGDGGLPLFSPKTIAIDSKNRAYVAEGLVDRVSAWQITGPVPKPQEEPPEPEAP